MSLFKGATELQIRNILRYSARDLNNEKSCAFILTNIGICFGIYYNQIMEYSFNDYFYKDKDKDYDYTNLFTNKLYRISDFEYRFYSGLDFGSKLEFQMFIKECLF